MTVPYKNIYLDQVVKIHYKAARTNLVMNLVTGMMDDKQILWRLLQWQYTVRWGGGGEMIVVIIMIIIIAQHNENNMDKYISDNYNADDNKENDIEVDGNNDNDDNARGEAIDNDNDNNKSDI